MFKIPNLKKAGKSIVTIFKQYIPQNKDYMLQERRDGLAMYACYTLR